MIVKNHHQATNIKFSYYLTTFLYLASIAAGLYFEIPNASIYIGCLTVLFLSLLIFSFQLKLNYIIYMDQSDKIIFRHYPLHPFHDKFKSIEIPKMEFSHFEIQKSLFKLRSEIVLFQMTPRGLAQYPPISITALSRKTKQSVVNSLKQYARSKQN